MHCRYNAGDNNNAQRSDHNDIETKDHNSDIDVFTYHSPHMKS